MSESQDNLPTLSEEQQSILNKLPEPKIKSYLPGANRPEYMTKDDVQKFINSQKPIDGDTGFFDMDKYYDSHK